MFLKFGALSPSHSRLHLQLLVISDEKTHGLFGTRNFVKNSLYDISQSTFLSGFNSRVLFEGEKITSGSSISITSSAIALCEFSERGRIKKKLCSTLSPFYRKNKFQCCFQRQSQTFEVSTLLS